MAFITIEDLVDNIECVVFPKVYDKYVELLQEGEVVSIVGKLQTSDADDSKILIDRIIPIEEEKNKSKNKLFIRLDSKSNSEAFSEVVSVLNSYKGNTDVIFYFSSEKLTQSHEKIKIDINKIEDITKSLKGHLEEKDIVLK